MLSRAWQLGVSSNVAYDWPSSPATLPTDLVVNCISNESHSEAIWFAVLSPDWCKATWIFSTPNSGLHSQCFELSAGLEQTRLIQYSLEAASVHYMRVWGITKVY